MKNPLLILIYSIIIMVAVPIILSITVYDDKDEFKINTKNEEAKEDTKYIENNIYEKVNKESPKIKVYNHKKNKVENIDIEEYLYSVVAGEMPSDFEEEALKAQAVAARTYVYYKKENGSDKDPIHKGADVCTNFNHCQEYLSEKELKKVHGDEWMKKSWGKIKKAVNDTRGQILVYDDKAILPMYFSTAAGRTENSEEVFSTKQPYLRSVESPYDKASPKYISNLKISKNEFIKHMKKSYNINLSSATLNSDIKILKRTEAGSVEKIKIGDKQLSGRDMRSILNLNSTNFDISIKNDYIDILVKGYGHGVGMSQWGADGMANAGYKYYKILKHYYTGSDIKDKY
ncbi:MAG TPA: stage II sporulation protein D [Peptostreptococcaceae bacterium]|nr:stage II sporulation protein D [Peptostreptococcaceae bacterium]